MERSRRLGGDKRLTGFPEKAEKDRQQALVLGARLVDSAPGELEQALAIAPPAMIHPIRPHCRMLVEKYHAGEALSTLLSESLSTR